MEDNTSINANNSRSNFVSRNNSHVMNIIKISEENSITDVKEVDSDGLIHSAGSIQDET